jgi:3-methylfumaryl-CoA hydratase
MEDLTAWIGRRESAEELITAAPAHGLRATLDHPALALPEGTPLPPLWHWLYFLPRHRQSTLGEDGHAERGGFLPPVPLPRRMWAGSRLAFHAPLRLGERVRRESCIESVVEKEGRNGPLVFVTACHTLHRLADGPGAPAAVVDRHDIVYRAARRPGEAEAPPQAAPTDAAWQRTVVPDDVLLFRYSALTFNGHRIHYDRRYVTGTEGYPGLVVHGPLIATLLLDLLARHAPEADVAAFSFRALRPTFDAQPLGLQGRPAADGRSVTLWATDAAGALLMQATAELR